MDKNHFSRQLIVLRAVIDGYSGHARLVRSGDSRDLELRIQAPADAGTLHAVLVENTGSGYRSVPLGGISIDDRGQANATFSIEDLDITPDVLAIVQQQDNCKLALSGFPDGPRNVNWADVRASACAAVDAPAPAAAQLPEDADPFAGFGSAADDPFRAPQSDAADSRTAAETAGISPDAVWPEPIAALQDAFETQPAVQAYPGSRFVFVRICASADTPEYLAGLFCLHGLPVRAAYAVPSPGPELCPQGLEDFHWRACDDGSGCWTVYVDAESGDPVADDY